MSKSLADTLESDVRIREMARANGQLTSWVSANLKGQPYVKNMLLNVRLLEIVGEYWCNQHSTPKLIPVPFLRKQVGLKRGMGPRSVLLTC